MNNTVANVSLESSGVDSIWISIFGFLLISTIIIHYYMVGCISDKAPGSKTLFDNVLKDMFWFTGTGGSLFCIIDIASRLEWVRYICRDHPILLIIPCVLYVYAFVSVCIQMGTICIVRILCIFNLTFMEETVGETLVRAVTIGFTFFWTVSVCVVYIMIDDMYSGTAMTLFTHHVLPTGPIRDKINMVVMLFTCISHLSLQVVAFVQKMWMKAAQPKSFTLNDIVKQTGVASGIVLMVLSFHVGITFWYPSKYKNHNYYLVKDLINSWFLFFCIPLSTVLKNDKMRHYVINRIKNSNLVLFVKDLYHGNRQVAPRPKANKIFVVELEVISLKYT